MFEEITHDEFMKLPTEKIREIVQEKRIPNVGVLIPDGTRKSAALYYNLTPEVEDFEQQLFSRINNELMKVIELMFSHGLKSLFIPSFTHGNLQRSKKYVDNAISYGFKFIFNDKKWFEFSKRLKIKINVYGDLNQIKEMGYQNLINWINDIINCTAKYDSHKLYFGLACSNKYEIPRIMDMCIDFYRKEKRYPTLKEKIKLYYGELVEDVDFFIRPTILRDSDIQPPLISGNKTQLYFPISPFIFINQNMFREILYDIIYQRTITYGMDDYNLYSIDKNEKIWLKNYYKINRNSIIGIGKKLGNYWFPLPQVKLDKSMNG